jgi:hypothetical protein
VTAGQLPEDRYGPRHRRHSRWAAPLWLALALLTGLAVALIGYHNLGPSPVESQTLTFTLLPDRPGGTAHHDAGTPAGAAPATDSYSVSLRFQVTREDPTRAAVCVVRARSLDGEETGRKEVYVPPGAGPVQLTTIIHTSRPPVTADVYGCSLQVPPYLSPRTAS